MTRTGWIIRCLRPGETYAGSARDIGRLRALCARLHRADRSRTYIVHEPIDSPGTALVLRTRQKVDVGTFAYSCLTAEAEAALLKEFPDYDSPTLHVVLGGDNTPGRARKATI